MTELNVAHPAPSRLVAFALGRLPEADAVVVRDHLATCAACREILEHPGLELAPTPPPSVAGTVGIPTPPPSSADAHEAPTLFPRSAGQVERDVPAALINHPRYHVLQFLGSGGMGAVYKAEHRLMERMVALKVIRKQLLEEPRALERFRQEVRAAARLAHPNIVTAYDAEQAADVHFLVMEFVEGMSLAAIVKKKGLLPVKNACDIVRQAALGLQHAHERHMIHRDIKPQNLMLEASGRVKILDFGLARFVRESDDGTGVTSHGVVIGTPDFISPEQGMDPRLADIRADIYSLGCTFYFLLTGQPPFPEGTAIQKIFQHAEKLAPPLSRFRSDVPKDVHYILDRMLAKRLGDRYQTPVEAAKSLSAFLKGPAAGSGTATETPALKAADSGARPGTAEIAKRAERPLPAKPRSDFNTPSLARRFKPKRRKGGLRATVRRYRWAILPPAIVLVAGLLLIGVNEWRGRFQEKSSAGVADAPVTKTLRAEPKPEAVVAPPSVPEFAKPEEKRVAISPDRRAPAFRLPVQGGVTTPAYMTLPVYAVFAAFFPDDANRALIVDAGGRLMIWELEPRPASPPAPIAVSPKPILCAALSSNGQRVIAGCIDGSVRCWDIGERSRATPFHNIRSPQHKHQILAVEFTADGESGRSIDSSGTILDWTFASNEVNTSLLCDEKLTAIASVNGYMGVSRGKMVSTDLSWDSERIPAAAQVTAICPVGSDGESALFGHEAGGIMLWDRTAKTRPSWELRIHSEVVNQIVLCPNKRFALSGSDDRTARLFEVATGKQRSRFEHTERVKCIASSTKWIVVGGGKSVSAWEMPRIVD